MPASVSCFYCLKKSETFAKKVALVGPGLFQWYVAKYILEMMWYVGNWIVQKQQKIF